LHYNIEVFPNFLQESYTIRVFVFLQDGQEGYFPLNAIVVWRDFSLNIKRYASQLVTPMQSRNPKEMSLENYLVYIPKPRESVHAPVEFSVHCFHVLGDSGKHDTFTAAVNIRKVFSRAPEEGIVDR